MKRLLNLLPLLLIGGLCSGQLVNDGGTIVIQAGAKLYVETDVTNNIVGANTGTITVNGELEVQGHLTNNGTMTTSSASLVKFSGNTNSNVFSNGAVIENMQMAKDGMNGTVTLTDDLTVKTNLDFQPSSVDSMNHLVIGAHKLKLSEQATTVTDPTSKDYIVADGIGVVEKTTTANSTFNFPIGDAMNYSPVEANYTGTGYSSANISANVVASSHPNKPIPTVATDFIARYWNVDQTGVTTYAATLTGQYAAADVTGAGGKVMGATQLDMSVGMTVADWTFTGSDNGANIVKATVSGDADLTGFNFFGKANLKVFLQGAYSAGSGLMSTTLPGLASFPLTTPYTVSPFNAPSETAVSVPANVTDWILVEARDPAAPATVYAQKSGFLKNDGTIVGLDGGPLVIKDSKPSSILSVQHRNHLAVRTNAGVNLALITPSLFDMSQDTAMYTSGASNTKMAAISGTNPTNALWAGNGNANGNSRYNGPSNDRAYLLGTILGGNTGGVISPSSPDSYNSGDFNMNGTTRYNGPSNDRAFLLGQVLGGNTGAVVSRHL